MDQSILQNQLRTALPLLTTCRRTSASSLSGTCCIYFCIKAGVCCWQSNLKLALVSAVCGNGFCAGVSMCLRQRIRKAAW